MGTGLQGRTALQKCLIALETLLHWAPGYTQSLTSLLLWYFLCPKPPNPYSIPAQFCSLHVPVKLSCLTQRNDSIMRLESLALGVSFPSPSGKGLLLSCLSLAAWQSSDPWKMLLSDNMTRFHWGVSRTSKRRKTFIMQQSHKRFI